VILNGVFSILPVPAASGRSNAVEVFDRAAERYNAWFDSRQERMLFRAAVQAIHQIVRHVLKSPAGPAPEVGVGTGRFAQVLGVPYGVDPALGALRLARRRGIRVVQARGEALPFVCLLARRS
jgi:hypothetical protein